MRKFFFLSIAQECWLKHSSKPCVDSTTEEQFNWAWEAFTDGSVMIGNQGLNDSDWFANSLLAYLLDCLDGSFNSVFGLVVIWT